MKRITYKGVCIGRTVGRGTGRIRRGNSMSIIKNCAICQKPFEITTKHGRPLLFCSDQCKEKAREKYYERLKFQTQAARRHPHTCPECGIRFHGFKDSIYCGDECRAHVGIRLAAKANKGMQRFTSGVSLQK